MQIIETEDVVIADSEVISSYSIEGDCTGCGASDILFEATADGDGLILSGKNQKVVFPFATADVNPQENTITNVKVRPIGNANKLDFTKLRFNETEPHFDSSLLSFYFNNKGSTPPFPSTIDFNLIDKMRDAMDQFISGNLKDKIEQAAAKSYIDICPRDKDAAEKINQFHNFQYPIDVYKGRGQSPADAPYIPNVKLSGRPKVAMCPGGGKFQLTLTSAINGEKKTLCVSAFIYFQDFNNDFGIVIDDLAQENDATNNAVPSWAFDWNPYKTQMARELTNALNSTLPNRPLILRPSNIPNAPGIKFGLSASRNIITAKLTYPLVSIEEMANPNYWLYEGTATIDIGIQGIIDAVRLYQAIQEQQDRAETYRQSVEQARQQARNSIINGQPATPTTSTSLDLSNPVNSNPGIINRPDTINTPLNQGNAGQVSGPPSFQPVEN